MATAVPSSERDKQLIRSALVVDYKEVFQALLERVKRVMVLDETGHAHLKVPRERLTDSQQIVLQLIARKFAHTIDLAPADTMSADELVRATGIPYKTITARVTGMKRKSWVEADARGAYRILYMAIEEIMNEVEARAGSGIT